MNDFGRQLVAEALVEGFAAAGVVDIDCALATGSLFQQKMDGYCGLGKGTQEVKLENEASETQNLSAG